MPGIHMIHMVQDVPEQLSSLGSKQSWTKGAEEGTLDFHLVFESE